MVCRLSSCCITKLLRPNSRGARVGFGLPTISFGVSGALCVQIESFIDALTDLCRGRVYFAGR
jgi:hypothetical protein